MKKLIVLKVLLFIGYKLFAQSPDLNYYSQFGFNVGYGYGKVKSGLSLGLVHGSVMANICFLKVLLLS
jgi:hypothetical protein